MNDLERMLQLAGIKKTLNESLESKIAILKKWAEDNYENGADTFVEAYGDSDFAELLNDNGGDVEKTLEFMERLASVWSERQADARYYRNEAGLDEKAPPGEEKLVRSLKKEYPGHEDKAFATAWSIYNKKHGKTNEGSEEDYISGNVEPEWDDEVAHISAEVDKLMSQGMALGKAIDFLYKKGYWAPALDQVMYDKTHGTVNGNKTMGEAVFDGEPTAPSLEDIQREVVELMHAGHDSRTAMEMVKQHFLDSGVDPTQLEFAFEELLDYIHQPTDESMGHLMDDEHEDEFMDEPTDFIDDGLGDMTDDELDELCPSCHGAGYDERERTCHDCHGTGHNEHFSDEPPGMSDVEADADTLASAGWGTDEDYGNFGGDDFSEGKVRVINSVKEGLPQTPLDTRKAAELFRKCEAERWKREKQNWDELERKYGPEQTDGKTMPPRDVKEAKPGQKQVLDPNEINAMQRLPHEQAKAEAIRLITSSTTSDDKKRYLLGQVERTRNTIGVIKLLYDMLLKGEGQGVVGSNYSKKFSETMDDDMKENFDLSNGYDEQHTADGNDYFPDGADGPVVSDAGPSGARQGDNPEQKKMEIEETYKELVYGYRDYLKESSKK